MPAPIIFQSFPTELGLEQHQLNTDELRMHITNVLPVNTQQVLDLITNHPPPAAANGYNVGGDDLLNSWAGVGGVATLAGTDITITATAGGIGPFQYIVMYNFTNPTDMLIQYYDHGSVVNLADGEFFVIDILTNLFTLASA